MFERTSLRGPERASEEGGCLFQLPTPDGAMYSWEALAVRAHSTSRAPASVFRGSTMTSEHQAGMLVSGMGDLECRVPRRSRHCRSAFYPVAIVPPRSLPTRRSDGWKRSARIGVDARRLSDSSKRVHAATVLGAEWCDTNATLHVPGTFWNPLSEGRNARTAANARREC